MIGYQHARRNMNLPESVYGHHVELEAQLEEREKEDTMNKDMTRTDITIPAGGMYQEWSC